VDRVWQLWQVTPRGKNFPLKGAWSGSRDRFGDETMLFRFCRCIDCGECQMRG